MNSGIAMGNITGATTTTAEPRRWKFCPWDGQSLQDDWVACPKCGERIGQQAAPRAPLPWNPYIGDPIYPQPDITWGPNAAGSTTYGPQPGDQITYTQ